MKVPAAGEFRGKENIPFTGQRQQFILDRLQRLASRAMLLSMARTRVIVASTSSRRRATNSGSGLTHKCLQYTQ